MNLDRLRRLLLLVPLARKHGAAGIPVNEAVAALHFKTEEELLADIEDLTLVGDPSSTPEGFVDVCVEDGRLRVFLAQGFTTPPRFTAVEGAALLATLRPLEQTAVPEVPAILQKLRAAMPFDQDQGAEAALLERATRIETRPAPPHRELLAEAIDKRLEVEVDYFAFGVGEKAVRVLEPRSLLLHGGRWYLVAWNTEKGEQHLYRLDRMSSVRIGTRSFGEHKGPSLDRYQLDHLYIPSGDEQDVEIGFSKAVANSVLQGWGEAAEQNDDGSVTVRAFLAGGNFLVSWVLAYGGEAEIIQPAELRDRLAQRVRELQTLYGSEPRKTAVPRSG